jgi:hypothetical protein
MSETLSRNVKSKSDPSMDRRDSNTSDKNERNVQNSRKFGSGIQVLPIQWRQEIKVNNILTDLLFGTMQMMILIFLNY